MTLPNITFGQYFPAGRKLALLLLVALGLSSLVGATVAQGPALAIGLMGVILLIAAAMTWPDMPTLVVCFILYTNAAVVAVDFHGVPPIIAASLPLLLVIPLAHYLIFRREKIIFHPLLLLLVIFLLIQMLGAINAIRIDAAISQLITYLTEGLGLYFLITNIIRSVEVLRRVLWVLLLAGAFMGGLSFYQQVTQTFDQNYGGFAQVSQAAFQTGAETLQGEVQQPRLSGPIGEENRYAQTLLMLVPIGLSMVWGKQSHKSRVLAIISTSLIALGVALTFSRGAAVGFLLMIVIMTFLGYIKLPQLIAVGVGLALLFQVVPEYAVRLTSLEALNGITATEDETGLAQTDGSTQSRLTEMAAAGLAFINHPFIGVGPGMFRYYYQDYAKQVGLRVLNADRQAHNLFLGLAAESGILGILCFIVIVFLTLRDLARTRRHYATSQPELANLATGLMLAVVSYLTTGLFLHLAFIRFFWIIMALAGVITYIAQTRIQSRQEGVNNELLK